MPRTRTISSALWSQDKSAWKGPQEVIKSNFLLKSGSAVGSDQVSQEVYPVRSCRAWWQWQCHLLDPLSAVNNTQDICPAWRRPAMTLTSAQELPPQGRVQPVCCWLGLERKCLCSYTQGPFYHVWGEFGDLLDKKTFSSPAKILSPPTLHVLVFCKTWKVVCDLIPPIRSDPEQAEEFPIYKSWQKPKIRTWLLTSLQLMNVWMHPDMSLNIQEFQKSKHKNLQTKNFCELTKLDSSSEGTSTTSHLYLGFNNWNQVWF